ncbi:MAG: hypothetical protein R3F30_04740 [Planctomycetota bacterium]
MLPSLAAKVTEGLSARMPEVDMWIVRSVELMHCSVPHQLLRRIARPTTLAALTGTSARVKV